MEVSEVRKRVNDSVERAKRLAAARRQRMDEAARQYETFLTHVAVPLVKQVAGSLKPLGYSFTVFTPGGSVRLMSDRSTDDYVEISLDTTGEDPVVVGHVSRSRGRRMLESEEPVATSIENLTEDHLLNFLLRVLEPFVER